MTMLRYLKYTVGSVAVAALAACGGGGGGEGGSTGTLRLALTDAPSCGFDAVHVTVQKVRVHQSSTAGDNDAGWSEIVLNPARRVDLLSLTNGVLMELGQIPLPTGKYTQMRLVLADNNTSQPLANAVSPTGASEVALKTPSGQQSGVKTNINIDIAENKMADFVLDFDACKSVVQAGASGQYLLKPVVSVIPRYVSGVQGYVDPALGAGATRVSLQVNGTIVKATVPDSTGKFLLQPVAPGNYTLVMAAPGRTTTVVTGVPVVAETVTPVASVAAPIALAPSASATVSGTAPADTLVRALQPLTTAGSVEVDGGYVNSVTGAYAYSLPLNAPLVGAYAVAPQPLVLTADAAAAARYTMRASLAGFADKQTVLPVLTGAGATANFTFP
ncbi:DUF4382 domain-containing protein [Acidovorax temperans]|jgi:hypothetical protein|uniref:DUF4382 domain-containing protein n=1 Tax=Acidovorax temperans TaxID=80878 RepID=UPI0028994922|nr:DUF4382 domain-containing protein [Acidovorax temperans]